jgi:hypothetical protein
VDGGGRGDDGSDRFHRPHDLHLLLLLLQEKEVTEREEK